MSGTIISPKQFRNTSPMVQARYNGGDDAVIILPVVRIERAPNRQSTKSGKRKRLPPSRIASSRWPKKRSDRRPE